MTALSHTHTQALNATLLSLLVGREPPGGSGAGRPVCVWSKHRLFGEFLHKTTTVQRFFTVYYGSDPIFISAVSVFGAGRRYRFIKQTLVWTEQKTDLSLHRNFDSR